jgi:hypothetical protein
MAAGTALAMLAPSQTASLLVARILPISEPHAAAAVAALANHDLQTAARETKAELSIAPVRQDGWVRLAKIDLQAHGKLTADGAAALSHAYDTAPYDLDPNSERLRLALQNFTDLPPELRDSVKDELGVWSSAPPLRQALQSLTRQIKDPEGVEVLQSTLARQTFGASGS